MSEEEKNLPIEDTKTTPWGKIPSWYNQSKQDIFSDKEWNEQYSKDWRLNEEILSSMKDFIQQYCKPDDRILDHGCGNGRNLFPLADRGLKVVGIDKSPIAVEKVKQRLIKENYSNAEVLQRNFFDMGFDPESFDIVVSSQTLTYGGCWTKIKEMFDKMTDVLKPDGHLYLRVRYAQNPIIDQFQDNYDLDEKLITKKGFTIFQHSQFKHFFTKEEIEFLADTYGMKMISIKPEQDQPTILADGTQRGGGLIQLTAIMQKLTRE